MSLIRKLLFASVLLNSVFAFGQKGLFCSSENMEIWYSYTGGFYYLSASVTPCFNGMQSFNMTYTAILLSQVRHIAYKASVWHNNKKWFEKSMGYFSCPHIKLCNILKGETLHDTVSIKLKDTFPKGSYEIFFEVINLDSDLKETAEIRIKVVIR